MTQLFQTKNVSASVSRLLCAFMSRVMYDHFKTFVESCSDFLAYFGVPKQCSLNARRLRYVWAILDSTCDLNLGISFILTIRIFPFINTPPNKKTSVVEIQLTPYCLMVTQEVRNECLQYNL